MKILHKYITRQALLTLFVTLCVFTFVLLLGRIMRQLSEMLVNRQVGIDVIGRFVLLATPTLLSLSLPMAMLATALLVFGRLSADNEITAMRASGIGLGQALAPVVLLAALMSACCFYLNASWAPRCKFALKTLFVQLGSERPLALIEEGVYMKEFPGFVLYVGKKKDRMIEDVTVYTLDANGDLVSSLRARYGIVTPKPEAQRLLLDLYDVRGDLRDPNDPTNVHKIRADTTAQRYPVELDLGKVIRQAATAKKLGDLEWPELAVEIRRLRNQGIYPAAALIEAHQRVAAAVACVAFTLIGIPLGLKTSRRETSIGIALSLALAVAFYFIMVLANSLKTRPQLYPEAILWFPNLAFELIGLWLLWRVTRV